MILTYLFFGKLYAFHENTKSDISLIYAQDEKMKEARD